MSGIEHVYTLNAVTALAFYQPPGASLLVLAGEGCHVKVYDASSARLVAQCRVFAAQTVHGITVAEPRSSRDDVEVIVWGGRSFAFLDAGVLRAVVARACVSVVALERRALDWILDGTLAPSGGGAACVFVTAHCAVLKAVLGTGSSELELVPLASATRSILYSAHAVWTSADSIMVAAGTMFGEIEVVMWQSINDEHSTSYKSRHLFTFTGHEGSIFGVRISSEIVHPNGKISRLLASCSDDRTIRIWSLLEDSAGQNETEATKHVLPSVRETGFGGNGDVLNSEVSAKRCIAVAMAHASRIWRVDFATWNFTASNTTRVSVLSFGEDSTCQYWSLDWRKDNWHFTDDSVQHISTRSKPSIEICPAVLNHLQTFAYHAGKHIWSTALLHVDQITRLLVTGGADGKISIYDILPHQDRSLEKDLVEDFEPEAHINELQKEPIVTSRSWAMEKILEKLPRSDESKTNIKLAGSIPISIKGALEGKEVATVAKRNKPAAVPKDFPNRYSFVTQNKLLATTSSGRVLLATIEKHCHWEELELPGHLNKDLLSYSLLLGLPEHGIAFLAGANGTIYMYSQDQSIMEIIKVKGKPAGLFHVSKLRREEIRILITILGSETAYLLLVKNPLSSITTGDELVMITLPNSFIVTSACNIGDLILVGSRNGSMAVYHLPLGRDPGLVYVDKLVKNSDAITSIVNIPSDSSSETKFYCLITSRNGSYSIFTLSTIPKEGGIDYLTLTLVHQAYPPFGPMIEDAWFNDIDLVLLGFQSKNLMIWNETKQYTIASIECGGAHRSYAYSPNYKNGSAGHSVYTKASKVYIHSWSQPSHRVLKAGGHGREIKACAQHGEFIATGSEDTTIRIWQRSNSNQEGNGISLECCAVIEKHTTGIQHLQWCCSSEDYHNLFSAGGAEEFYVWAVSTIPGFGIGVVCEAALTDHSEDNDLRIMGFHVEFFYDTTPRRIGHENNQSRNHKYHISLIYSDSTIKAYRYSRREGFTKIAQGAYTSACLTQITAIEKYWPHTFLTASTDGYLCLWSFPVLPQATITPSNNTATAASTQIPKLTLLSYLPVHQSSISALAVEHLTLLSRSSSKWTLVATAGDDNAIALTLLHTPLLLKGKSYTPIRRIIIPSAHAAGIAGLAFKSDMTGGPAEGQWVQLWSVGGDQRVKRWAIEILQDENTPDAATSLRVHRVRPEDDIWTSVADPSDLAAFHKGGFRVSRGDDNWCLEDDESFCLVVGNGMEMFMLKDGFPNGDGSAWEGITWERRGAEGAVNGDEKESDIEEM